MKRFILLFLSILISQTSMSEQYMMTAAAWPPFIEPEHPQQGISVHLIRTALARAGHSSSFMELPWQRSLSNVQTGKYDILPALWFSQERAKTLIFSHAYTRNKMVFIKRKGDDFEFSTFADLDNKTIGLVSNYAYDQDFLAYEGYQRSFTPSVIQNLKMLVLNRVDITISDEIVVRRLLKQQAPELLEKIEFVNLPLSESPLHLACGKINPKCPQIIEDFNRELAAMKAEGSYEQIMGVKPVHQP